ncbi:MAG: amino acid ABC transporter permease [Acidimicrobiia bacterium]
MTAPDILDIPVAEEDLAPAEPGLRGGAWVRKRLLSTWYNAALTVVMGVIFAVALWWLVRFLLTRDFEILRVNLALMMVGGFPRNQLWRPALALILAALLIGLVAGMASASAAERSRQSGLAFDPAGPMTVIRRFWPVLLFALVLLLLTRTPTPWLVALATLVAGVAGSWAGRALPARVRRLWLVGVLILLAAIYVVLSGGGVGWDQWGGLQLNIFLTVAGIALAFPLGLLLALGRRSTLPVLRIASVTYIEFIRGVPLITLLLMGIFVIGFFLPRGLGPGDVTRVLIAITLFESAYIAEVVRGGLQSVPKGQVEAAQAVGLAPWRTMRHIVVPQALRNTIPAMVGQFISLFKDTTLVVIVGMIDILGASQSANTQPDFLAQGLHLVTLPFVGFAFWVGSYSMSREARRLERKLGVGER